MGGSFGNRHGGKLAAWARSVKAQCGTPLPPLWLFTDARIADLPRAIRCLPCGCVGVVVREGALPDRATARRLLRLCAARKLALSFAVPPPILAPRNAGQHWRGGRGRTQPAAFRTSSAHDPRELCRASLRGAALIFLSPVFPTASHPGARPLGPLRFAALTGTGRRHRMAALGGIDPKTLARLPGWCRFIGAIALLG